MSRRRPLLYKRSKSYTLDAIHLAYIEERADATGKSASEALRRIIDEHQALNLLNKPKTPQGASQ